MASVLDQIRTDLPHIAVREQGRELVASPATTEEVSDILRYCNEHNIPIEITGGRTKRTWQGTVQAQLVLDTTRLTGVREHPWQDLTATVGAGTPWAEMQRALAAHNQFVALDPLWPERATVGGILSTNDSGALRLKYGSARDLVIGMILVLADGTIAKTGGKVVKNVAGYDLHKLMIGAFGTLAVITEVTFRLHPLPAHRATWSVASPEIGPIGKLIAAITSSHLNPEAMQIRTTPTGFSLDVLLAAAPEVLRAKGDVLTTMAASHNVPCSVAEEARDAFRAREFLFAPPTAPIAKISALQTAVPTILSQVARSGMQAVAYPLGIIYAGLGAAHAIPQTLCSHVQQSEGSFTILGESAAPTGTMREIKRQFDPNRILNRGLMGGL